MKILQVNKYLDPKGGSESYMFNLSSELRRRGHAVEMWGMASTPKDNWPNRFDYSDLNVFEKMLAVVSSVYSRRNRRMFSNVLDDFKPDIIHIHNFNFQLTPSILFEALRRNIPIVYTAHDSQLCCPFHRLYNEEKKENCELCIKKQFYNCLRTKCIHNSYVKSMLGTFESYLYHGLNIYNDAIRCIISPSRFLEQRLRGVFSGKIEVVPNFSIDHGFSYEFEDYSVFVGRVSEAKGVVLASSLYNDMGIPLRVVGYGPALDVLKGTRFVRLYGALSGSKLHTLIRNAQFLIVPSVSYENCPMTILEAYSFGTPVIGSNHSGIADLIDHGETGFVFDWSSDSIRSDLQAVYANYSRQLAVNAREAYDTKYSVESHLSKIITIYSEL